MKINEEIQEIINSSPIASNAIFSTVFNHRPDRAVFLIEDILNYLNISNYKIISCETQTRNSHFHQHDNVMDLKIKTDSDIVVIFEFELGNKMPPKRVRYYLSSDDVSELIEGME